MNIGSISSSAISSNMSSQALGRAGGDGDGDDGGKRAGGPRGKLGRMFQQLDQLSQSDPAKFKQVAADMAKSLRADAQQQTADAAARLTKLADGLDKASQTAT